MKKLEKILNWNEIFDYYYEKYGELKADEKYKDLVEYFNLMCEKNKCDSPVIQYQKSFNEVLKYFKENERKGKDGKD